MNDIAPPEWRSPHQNTKEHSRLVWAHSATGEFVRYVVHPETLRLMVGDSWNRGLGDYCGLVHGDVPNRTRGLLSAHALSRGVKRPCLDVGRDDQILIYVLSPDDSFVYPTNARTSGIGPTPWVKPKDSVFVVYVDPHNGTYKSASAQEFETAGTILFWEWVRWDETNHELPADYSRRYATWVW